VRDWQALTTWRFVLEGDIRVEESVIAYVKVLGVNVAVLWLVEVLLRNEDTLAEEILVDELAVGLFCNC
jgi:hypothetical protein